MPSLIRVFAVGLKKAKILSYPLSAWRRLIRLGGCSGWSESLPGAHAIFVGFVIVWLIFCFILEHHRDLCKQTQFQGDCDTLRIWQVSIVRPRNINVLFPETSRWFLGSVGRQIVFCFFFGNIFCKKMCENHSKYPKNRRKILST